jgi:hypothetical protein
MRRDGTLVRFSGILNEESDLEKVKAQLEPFHNQNVRVSFAEVVRANSCGITSWLRLVRDLDLAITYVEAPVWLVEQFNISPFFLRKAYVESFCAPFFDPSTGNQSMQLVTVGQDIRPSDVHSEDTFAQPLAPHLDGLEPDFDPTEYLHFLTAMAKPGPGQGTP